MKSNTNRQQLKLKNYNLSPTNLSPPLYNREGMLKSESKPQIIKQYSIFFFFIESETNSESMNPFELEPFNINNVKNILIFFMNLCKIINKKAKTSTICE